MWLSSYAVTPLSLYTQRELNNSRRDPVTAHGVLSQKIVDKQRKAADNSYRRESDGQWTNFSDVNQWISITDVSRRLNLTDSSQRINKNHSFTDKMTISNRQSWQDLCEYIIERLIFQCERILCANIAACVLLLG